VWFYNHWKQFGSAAFELVDLKISPYEGEALLEKLVLIDENMPAINAARKRRAEAAKPKTRPDKSKRKR
jgi:hypothetical protein